MTDAMSPARFLAALSAHQLTAALGAALQLGVFDAIARGCEVPESIAPQCHASERGIRMLCDFLVIHDFLHKREGRYALAADTAAYLVRGAPGFLGDVARFILAPEMQAPFADLAGCVRRGGTTLSAHGTMETGYPVWVEYARVMGPLVAQPAGWIAALADPDASGPLRVLDLAAGHGLFGIAFAQRNARAQVTVQDWAPVLEVALEHARAAGVADRMHLLPGDAFRVDLGAGHDVVVVANFLHHFDPETCVRLLGRVHAALRPGGVAVLVEYVPGEDRVTPPPAAAFALVMLATTAGGDAYPFDALAGFLARAGFASSSLHPAPGGPQCVVLARR